MNGYQLGQKVSISGTVVKSRGNSKTSFIESELPTRKNFPTPKVFTEGVIVGRRTVADGNRDSDDDYGYYFTQINGASRNVWLVAFDMRMKPAMCLDHQVKPLEETP